MRLLLIAYEFPPIEAAQALRWAYLSRELVHHGHEVHVLTVYLPSMAESRFQTGAKVHRVFAGPFVGLSSYVRSLATASVSPSASGPPPEPGLAERIYRRLRRALDFLVFPDLRSEWLPFAHRAGSRLLASRRFDLILASHEPGVDLILGLRLARRFALPLISDLGDPVLAPYTPRWRRALHRSLERSVLAASASVLVTNESTRELLCRRHGVDRSRITVLSQGYSEDVALEAETAQRPSGLPLKLFYSGSLYRGLRSAAPVFDALSRIEDVELAIAGDVGEEGVPAGGRVRFVGRLSHAEVLEWQRRSDVLLSIGNTGTVQVPGKIFEYFGARRPVLHVATDPADACVSLVASLRRGVCCTAEPEQIVAVLTRLRRLKRDGQLDASFELGLKSVEEYSWKRIGDRLSQLCDRVVQGRGHEA